jgi:hypothetical protein
LGEFGGDLEANKKKSIEGELVKLALVGYHCGGWRRWMDSSMFLMVARLKAGGLEGSLIDTLYISPG